MDHGNELIRSIVAPLGELRDGAQASLEGLDVLDGIAQQQANEGSVIASSAATIVNMASDNAMAAQQVDCITSDLGQMAVQLQASVNIFRI
jgi:methyl-accepting chemotaxis protein